MLWGQGVTETPYLQLEDRRDSHGHVLPEILHIFYHLLCVLLRQHLAQVRELPKTPVSRHWLESYILLHHLENTPQLLQMPRLPVPLEGKSEGDELVDKGHARLEDQLRDVLRSSVALLLRGGDFSSLRKTESHIRDKLGPCRATQLELSDILSEVFQEEDFDLGDSVGGAETCLRLQEDPA